MKLLYSHWSNLSSPITWLGASTNVEMEEKVVTEGENKARNSHFSEVGVRSIAQKWAEDLPFFEK